MITCPGCNNSLPDWAKTCQFCGRDVSKVPRPAAAPAAPRYVRPVNTWIVTAYYAIAVWYIIGGLRSVGTTLYESRQDGFGGFTGIGLIFGIATLLIGIGLLMKLEIIRNIVVFFAGLAIIFGVIGLFFSIGGTLFTGWFGLLMVVMTLLDIIANALLIYVIGEMN